MYLRVGVQITDALDIDYEELMSTALERKMAESLESKVMLQYDRIRLASLRKMKQ